MTTIRQLVIDGLRESGIQEVGTVPEAEEFDEGLRRLLAIIRSSYGDVMGEALRSYSYNPADQANLVFNSETLSECISTSVVPVNVRLIFSLTAATTIYLQPNPEDGARFAIIDNSGNFSSHNLVIDANGRRIETLTSVTLSTDSLVREWFYRADLGTWVRVETLTADDESPFPTEFDDLFSITLAIRLNPRYGADTKQETVAYLKSVKNIFRARYSQKHEVATDIALLRTPGCRSLIRYC